MGRLPRQRYVHKKKVKFVHPAMRSKPLAAEHWSDRSNPADDEPGARGPGRPRPFGATPKMWPLSACNVPPRSARVWWFADAPFPPLPYIGRRVPRRAPPIWTEAPAHVRAGGPAPGRIGRRRNGLPLCPRPVPGKSPRRSNAKKIRAASGLAVFHWLFKPPNIYILVRGEPSTSDHVFNGVLPPTARSRLPIMARRRSLTWRVTCHTIEVSLALESPFKIWPTFFVAGSRIFGPQTSRELMQKHLPSIRILPYA